jgi:uncharacterized protein YkwD/LysM repeat protein
MTIKTTRKFPQRFNLLWLFLLVITLGSWPRPVQAQDAGGQVVAAINQARAENGLGQLAVNPLLSQAAQNHVNDMLTNYVYGHYGSDGSTVHMRVARTGYSDTPWVSENWVSASSADGAMRWWMGDYIHRVNILTPRWVEVGVGVGTRGSEMIFVTVFSAGGGTTDGTYMVAEAPPVEAPPPPSVKIEQVIVPSEGLDYTVRSGDTLLAIGLRYGLPWERIAEANGLNERSLLQIGQSVRIPGADTPVGPPPPEVPAVETEDYVVQPNDTLYTIAARRDMYWDEVAGVNGFGAQTVLQIGQVIQVPVVEKASRPETKMLVHTRQAAGGPLTAETAAGNFGDYTLTQFGGIRQPNQAILAQSNVPETGAGGPVSQVAMANTEVNTQINTQANAQANVAANLAVPVTDPEVAVIELAMGAPEAAPPETVIAETVVAGTISPEVVAMAKSVPETAEAAALTADLAAMSAAAPDESAHVASVSNQGSNQVPVEEEVTVAVASIASAPQEDVLLYTVEPGDTIISIAVKHDLEWGPLLSLNGLSSESVLQPGQVIRLQ